MHVLTTARSIRYWYDDTFADYGPDEPRPTERQFAERFFQWADLGFRTLTPEQLADDAEWLNWFGYLASDPREPWFASRYEPGELA